METRFKLLGHPVHPMLIVLPLGLLSIGVLFDFVYLVGGDALFAEIAFWNIAAGIVGGLIAALFGLIDWLELPSGTRAKRIGLWHGLGNVVIVGLFAVSWWLRLGDHAYLPNLVPLLLGVAGAALALVTAWLGGELVYRLRVAVDSDAHLDASNSLTRQGVVSVRARAPRGGTAGTSAR